MSRRIRKIKNDRGNVLLVYPPFYCKDGRILRRCTFLWANGLVDSIVEVASEVSRQVAALRRAGYVGQ